MHREYFCFDVGGAAFGDRRAKVPVAPGARSSGRAAGIHYPAASVRCAREARIAPGLRPAKSSACESTHHPTYERRLARFLLAAVGYPECSKGSRTAGMPQLGLRDRCYLPGRCEASSECVCITRKIESRVTIPTICGAWSVAPLTTGIWLMSAVSSRSRSFSSGSSGEVH
jgi:hypothetical protein